MPSISSRPAARIRPGGGAAVAGLLLVLGLSACGAAPADPLPAGYGSPPAAGSPSGSASAPSDAEDDAAPSPPTSVELKDGESAPVRLSTVTEEGFLGVPEEVSELGWWVGSSPMGSATGTTLIAGHVDSKVAGLGYFSKLSETAVGDTVKVVDGEGRASEFVISEKEEVIKAELPKSVYDTEGERRLALVTCGGPFDKETSNYRDNLIVWATPA